MNPSIADLMEHLRLQGAAYLPTALISTAADDFARRARDLADRWREKETAEQLDGEDSYALKAGTIHFQALIQDEVGRAFLKDLFPAVLAGPIWRLFRRLFGSEVGFPLRACSIRWHHPPFEETPVPLHQDVGFMGADFPVMNCWLTLTEAGVDAAGLEIAPIKLSTELPKLGDPLRATNRNFWSIEIDQDAAADRLMSVEPLRPSLRAGDALLFDQFTPHRTLTNPTMTKTRVSVELRGCRAADLAPPYRFNDRLVAFEAAGALRLRHDPSTGLAAWDLNNS